MHLAVEHLTLVSVAILEGFLNDVVAVWRHQADRDSLGLCQGLSSLVLLIRGR